MNLVVRYTHLYMLSLLVVVLCFGSAIQPYAATVLLSEDFEGLNLGPFLDESLASVPALDNTKVWTNQTPAGWSVDNSWLPAYGGVRDWYGWTFANAQAWAFVAGDQRRTEFTNAKGVCAIADSDEWDDMAHEDGLYETYMSTPDISIAGLAANTLLLTFDSSWRPEGAQDANIMASFDGGAPVEILYWDSTDGSEWFHSDESTNEFVTVQINNPANAKTLKLTFGYMNASNNWFWAIDNIKIASGDKVVFSEDFEGLVLGPFMDEILPADVSAMNPEKIWTKTPPTGWVQDDSLMPANGVRDWWGWTFANALAWSTVAGDQRRSEFAKAKGVAAIADSDEWDDMAHDSGNYEAYLSTPEISLVGMDANSVTLAFDSSWRPEGAQFANITVSFDGAEPVEILYWNSTDGDPNFHPDTSTNESVSLNINNPAGAKKMVLKFGYGEASNNWFWAIDNLVVSSSTYTGVNDWQLF